MVHLNSSFLIVSLNFTNNRDHPVYYNPIKHLLYSLSTRSSNYNMLYNYQLSAVISNKHIADYK